MCGSLKLAVRANSRDLVEGGPGRLVLARCRDCGHVFRNPGLSPEGRAFYRGLARPRTGEGVLEARAAMVEGFTDPRRWLDVGPEAGRFAGVARERWPRVAFEGVDPGEEVEEAGRRGELARAHRGELGELAGTLSGSFDIVSLFELASAGSPLETLDAAVEVLTPGGWLLLEVPDPESGFGKVLGPYWGPWAEPRSQHFLPFETLEAALEARGLGIVQAFRADAHRPVDLQVALALLVNRLAPPAVAWRPRGGVARAWRGLVRGLSVPVAWSARAGDRILWVWVRRGRRGNTYRVLARRGPDRGPRP